MLRVGLVFLIACGGAKQPPKPPKVDTRALAAELDAQMSEVAAIVRTRRTDCPRMAGELRAVFARMTVSLERARLAQQDPEIAKQLTTDVRAYDAVSAQRVAAIGSDFTVDAPCARDPAVRDALQTMPTL